jgi:transcription antitermination factor NusG
MKSLSHRAVEHFLPCYRSLRHWKDRRVELMIPLFPGYVFARLPFRERLKVLTVPSVVSLVGPQHAPSVVSEEEITWIKKGVEHGNAAPHEHMRVGQRVVIKAGALAGMEGILVRMINKTRVIISLDSIFRSFAVEVEADCVRPIERQSRHVLESQVSLVA